MCIPTNGRLCPGPPPPHPAQHHPVAAAGPAPAALAGQERADVSAASSREQLRSAVK